MARTLSHFVPAIHSTYSLARPSPALASLATAR